MRLFIVITACLALGGCASPTKEIGEKARRVEQLAVSSEARAQSIETLSTDPVVKREAQAIQAEQAEIRKNTEGVQGLLAEVQDKPGFFARLGYLLKLGWWSLILALVVIVIWQTGAAKLIAPAFAMLGLFPRGVVSVAKLAGEALETDPENKALDKIVATHRASDPLFNRAYVKEKKRRERQRARTA